MVSSSRVVISMLVFALAATGANGEERSPLDKPVASIVKKLVAKIPREASVLLLDLQDLDGRTTFLNRHITDTLLADLANTRGSATANRQTLADYRRQMKLRDAMLDDATAVAMGQILGTETVVYGTAADLEGAIVVNLMIVSVDKGAVIGGVSETIQKNKNVKDFVASFKESEEKAAERIVERKVMEVKMEEAVRARMKLMQKNGANARAINPDLINGSASEVDTSEVWRKLQQSVDFE